MHQISGMVKNLISCYLILHILIQAVPGDKYRKYVRAFGGFLMIVTFLGQIPFLEKLVSQDAFSGLVQKYVQGFERSSDRTAELGNLAYESMMSAMGEEMKTRLNKSEALSPYVVNTVKVNICDDESDERYGEMEGIVLYISESTEKTTPISVNKIEIGQYKTQNNKERETVLENVVAEELGVGPEIVSVRLR